MKIDPEKLEKLFKEKFQKIMVPGSPDATYERWIWYCDEHKIFMLHPEWLADTLNEGLKGRICIHNPEEQETASPWLLVPKKFAEKCLVLGGLP